MTSATSGRRLLLFVAFLAFVSIGFPDAVLGVAWPSIRDTFERPRADLGFLLFGASAGYFTSGVIAGKAIERLGVGRLLVVSTALVTTGLLGYVAFPGFWWLTVAAAMIGLGSGAVDAGLNYFAAEHFSVAVMNWLHAFFGIGAMIGPFIMAGVLATDATWRLGYVIVAAVTAAMALAFVQTRGLWSDSAHHSDAAREPNARMREVARQPMVWLQVGVFFVMTGIEACAGAWAFTMLTERFGMDDGPAGLWAGFYWGALAAGRLVLPVVTRSVAPARVIQIGSFGLLIAALLMTVDRQLVYQAGLLLFGLSMAPMFPTLMSLTPERLGKHVSIHAIGFQVSAAVLGGAAIPSLAGVLAGSWTLAAIPWVIVAGASILIGLESWLRGRTDGMVIDAVVT